MAVAIRQLDPSRSDDLILECHTHRRALRAHCRRMLGSVVDADDAVQETLLRAWRAGATFERRCSTSTWLHRIATNVCLDMLSARGRRPTIDVDADVDAGAAPGADVVETVVGRAEAARLVAHVVGLPARQRSALVLRDAFGWPAEDVAQLLGCSVAAANSALQRARANLRPATPPAAC